MGTAGTVAAIWALMVWYCSSRSFAVGQAAGPVDLGEDLRVLVAELAVLLAEEGAHEVVGVGVGAVPAEQMEGVVAGGLHFLQVPVGPVHRDRLDVEADGGELPADLGIDLLGRGEVGAGDVERVVELEFLARIAGLGQVVPSPWPDRGPAPERRC